MKMDINTEIQRRVMRRVYMIYALRKLSEPIFIKSALFAAFLVAFASIVSVSHVLSNVSASAQNMEQVFNFFTAAFSNSMFTVKLIILAELFVGMALIKDILERINILKINFR